MQTMIVQRPSETCLIIMQVEEPSFEVLSINSIYPSSISIYDPENARVKKNRGELCEVVEVSDSYVKVKFNDSDKLTKITNFLDLKEYVPPEPEPPPKPPRRSSTRSKSSSGTTRKRTSKSSSTPTTVGKKRTSRKSKS